MLQKACQAIAVLLHYFFLVTFMWMLMEGVVLYVALVRVFVKKQKYYIAAFTIVSYGMFTVSEHNLYWNRFYIRKHIMCSQFQNASQDSIATLLLHQVCCQA